MDQYLKIDHNVFVGGLESTTLDLMRKLHAIGEYFPRSNIPEAVFLVMCNLSMNDL